MELLGNIARAPQVPPVRTELKRVLQLDILRSVAILLVIGRHLEVPRPGGLIGFLADLWFRIGWLGVDLFFVLSGFLIGGLLISEHQRHGRIDVGRFLVRRGLKIYPPYFVFISYLILMPTAKTWLGHGDAWGRLYEQFLLYWPNLLFLQNYVGTNPAGHTWSLAVEEHFYLVLPFALLALIVTQRTRWLTPLCLVVVPLFVLAVRSVSVSTADVYAVQMAATHLRLDALLFGVGIRAVAEYRPEWFAAARHWKRSLILAGVLLWLPNGFIDPATPFIRTIGLTWTLLGAAAFLLAAYHTHAADFGDSRRWVSPVASLMGWIGVYSYAIYLWHVTTMGVMERAVGLYILRTSGEFAQLRWLVCAVLISGAAIVVGVIAGRIVEWPVLRLRDRFFPSRSGQISCMPDSDTQKTFLAGKRPAAAVLQSRHG